MTSGRPQHSSAAPRRGPSAPIALVDRSASRREAVVGWNPDTAGFEAAISLFDADPTPGSDPATASGRHDAWIPGSSPPSTLPSVMIIGREPHGDPVPVFDGRDVIGPVAAPGRRSLCLTVDSLLDALRFEGFRLDDAATEAMSDLAERIERHDGTAMLWGRTWRVDGDPWIRLDVEHHSMPAGLTVFKGRCCGPLGMLEAARCIIELCWTRWWTPTERDLALTLALEVLADAGEGFHLPAVDIAQWCLADRCLPGPGSVSPGSGSPSVPSQLRLAV